MPGSVLKQHITNDMVVEVERKPQTSHHYLCGLSITCSSKMLYYLDIQITNYNHNVAFRKPLLDCIHVRSESLLLCIVSLR